MDDANRVPTAFTKNRQRLIKLTQENAGKRRNGEAVKFLRSDNGASAANADNRTL